MSRTGIAKIICLSAGVRSLRASYRADYLADKAIEAAKVIEKHVAPELLAVVFASIAGNFLNELSPGRIGILVEEAAKTLECQSVLEMDACIEEIVGKDAKERSDALDTVKAEEKKAEQDKKEPQVIPQVVPPVVHDVVPEVVPPTPPVVAPEVPKADDSPSTAASPSIDTLAIAVKHKAALKAAGLATFADVILYEQTKGIESLPDIGEKSANQILTLVGYKKAE